LGCLAALYPERAKLKVRKEHYVPALYPERAKLKVRKEHYVLAELHRLLPVLESANTVVWDCPFPGGCSLKRPDHLYAWPERYLHIEVDEEGHADYGCEEEDSRLELIAAISGAPGSWCASTRTSTDSSVSGRCNLHRTARWR
jgi:hypothetical protein